MTTPIRVLAVDDSAVARTMYRALLAPESGFDLVATAPNADIARRKITALEPDVIVLDIEMPGEDGLSLLGWIMQHAPTAVVVSSSFSPRGAEQTMRAFSLGAVDVVCKTAVAGDGGQDFPTALVDAVRAASTARRSIRRHRAGIAATVAAPAPATATRSVLPAGGRIHKRGTIVVIGASTGGTEALAKMVMQMPPDFPPTIVVQHMPPIYTRAFAQRLDTLGSVRVEEAVEGRMIGGGEVLIAPGGMQTRIVAGPTGPMARVRSEAPVNRHAPSVDVLFDSAAEHYRNRVIAVLLTGMGNDGARGLRRIRDAGGHTIAQDEASSVVWGMPQEAIKLGAAEAVLPVDQVIPRIVNWLTSAH